MCISSFRPSLPAGLLLASLSLGCGSAEEPQSTSTASPGDAPAESADSGHSLPSKIDVAAPAKPIRELTFVEDQSEDVANHFVEFADKLRRRDFVAASAWVAEDFVGHGLMDLATTDRAELPLGAVRTQYDVETAPIHTGAGFLASVRSWIAPWSRMEAVVWKVKGAEFEAGTPLWGKIKFKTSFIGDGEDGGPRSVVAWGHARVEKREGRWQLVQYQLDSLTTEERSAPIFTDVSTSTGVAHTGIRFGKAGNKSFAWNGAATGDVNGDELWDIFVPSRPANFLYIAQPDGTFVNEAAAWGIADPGGGTGAVFFDFDHDGDQDLALADVGWVEGHTRGGNPLRFYVNEGEERFVESGTKLGFDANCNAYTLVVLDYDSDSWPDIFVCNYGRVEGEPNDSWIDAKNGMPNALYRNLEGKGFEEVAAQVGLVDTRWTYAAAAADPDGDGDPDLYVANDYGPNSYWVNEGGRFTDVAAESGITDLGNGMGADWADLNGDGVLDLYVANMSSTAGNRILGRLVNKDDTVNALLKMAAGNSIFFRGTAGSDAPSFERAPKAFSGIGASWAWSSAIFDLDLDGHSDLYCASGFVTGDTAADT